MFNRIYEDYFKRSRLDNYYNLLNKAKNSGYHMVGILDFFKMIDSPGWEKEKILINRHDIDTSPAVARRMFEIEKQVYGKEGSATYYFRRKTIDKRLIEEIEDFGYETGFHYETIANYAKKKHLHRKEEVLAAMPQIRRLFLDELKMYRMETSSESLTTSSHGDFVNVNLGIMNTVLLEDRETREKAGIVLEAYDDIVNKHICERFADQVLLGDFALKVEAAIERKIKIIMILTHPRNQKVDLWFNTRDNIERIVEGIAYRIRK